MEVVLFLDNGALPVINHVPRSGLGHGSIRTASAHW
jgi:hypothetical protein